MLDPILNHILNPILKFILTPKQQAMTPITPLESGVEMFQKGKLQPFFAARTGSTRPISEATEIYDTDFEDDSSEFEEDYSHKYSFNSVCLDVLTSVSPRLTYPRTKAERAKPQYPPWMKCKLQKIPIQIEEPNLILILKRSSRSKDQRGLISSTHLNLQSISILHCNCLHYYRSSLHQELILLSGHCLPRPSSLRENLTV